MKLNMFIIIVLAIICSSCAWLGVERQKVAEKELPEINAKSVVPEISLDQKITLGMPIKELTQLLGQGKAISTTTGGTLVSYPAAYQVKSGATVCLALIPLPLRSTSNGEYRFYFEQDLLVKITMLATESGFYGVYVDDSGAGKLSGEKSKCNI